MFVFSQLQSVLYNVNEMLMLTMLETSVNEILFLKLFLKVLLKTDNQI